MEHTQTLNVNGHRLSCAYLEVKGSEIVIFCHGYRGSSIGPNRLFVDIARKLAEPSISSLRFDQFGSGNSEGSFYDSSFKDWVLTTKQIAKHYLSQGFKVILFGQSMGGSTVIDVGSQLNELSAIVAWVPDPNIEKYTEPKNGIFEEYGQIVQSRYWREAYTAKIADKLKKVKAPTYIVQCGNDEYVSQNNQQAIIDNAQAHHKVEMFNGYVHSNWTHRQAAVIVKKSLSFVYKSLGK